MAGTARFDFNSQPCPSEDLKTRPPVRLAAPVHLMFTNYHNSGTDTTVQDKIRFLQENEGRGVGGCLQVDFFALRKERWHDLT